MTTKSHVYERLEDQSETLEPVSPVSVEEALGAEAVPGLRSERGSPFSIGAIRTKLLGELVSTGGRRGRKEAVAHKKVPLTEREWKVLDEITALLKGRGVNATSGQVAGVLLHQSMTEVLLRMNRVSPVVDSDSVSPAKLTDEELEGTLDTILAAAASAEVYLGQLKPVASELLRRMRSGKGAENDEE